MKSLKCGFLTVLIRESTSNVLNLMQTASIFPCIVSRQPLISIDRFIDEYQSRNEELADIMRRMGFCEEKGSGMDKALTAIEKYQLPPIKYRVSDIRTTIILSAFKKWSDTSKEERVMACYQYACLKYLANEMLTNKSLRERLGVDEKNYPLISVVIKEAMAQGLIKVGTP